MTEKERLFLFIAKKLEGVGSPKGDVPTLYGITETNYKRFYDKIKNAIDTKSDVTTVILEAYNHLYDKSKAELLPYPLNFQYFDFFVNSEVAAVKDLQYTLNVYLKSRLSIDGDFGKRTAEVVGALSEIDKYVLKCIEQYYVANRIQHYLEKTREEWRDGVIHRVVKLQKYLLRG